MCVFADVLLYRKRQRQTREEMTNMNVLDDTAWLHGTPAEKVSVYEALPPDTEGYDNPIANDDVGFNSPEQPPSNASTQDGKTYTPLALPPTVNIGHNGAQEPPADTKYLVLVDDERKLGNPSEVPPPHKDNNTQEPPSDSTYLMLVDDEGKLGNPPEVPTPHEDNNTQEPPADSKDLVLVDDEGKLGNPSEVPPPHEDNNIQEPPADSKYLVLVDDESKFGKPTEVSTPHEDNNIQDPPDDTKHLALLDDEENTPDVAPAPDSIDEHHSSFA